MKPIASICLLSLLLFFTNCITTIAPGFLYSGTTEHIYPAGSKNQLGIGRIERRAESCAYNSMFVNLFYHSQTDSIESIMVENKISKIGVIDYRSFNVFGPFLYSNCIIVWGEP